MTLSLMTLTATHTHTRAGDVSTHSWTVSGSSGQNDVCAGGCNLTLRRVFISACDFLSESHAGLKAEEARLSHMYNLAAFERIFFYIIAALTDYMFGRV